jgi:DNA-binding MarR family transcriptional regulator
VSGELSLAQYRVLSSIASGDERASRIADRLALGKPTISATVDALNQRGLVTRGEVDEDQRAAALRLTPAGTAALHAAEQAMTERLARLVELTPDPAALVRSLIWLDDAIEEHRTSRNAGERP